MKKAILSVLVAIALGCVGGSEGPVDGHSNAIIDGIALEEVRELGIDEGGCDEAVEAGGQIAPVVGRPDLVGLVIGGAVICITTLEAALEDHPELARLVRLDQSATPPSGEPEPEPYEPEPEPYRGSDDGSSD